MYLVIGTNKSNNYWAGESMRRVLSFLFGLVSYLIFLASFLYAIGFVGDLAVPKTINAPVGEYSVGTALGVNLALLGLFAIQHSGMARQSFKEWWTNIIPGHLERGVYVLITSLLLFLLYWQWRPMPETIWSVESGLGAGILWAVFGLGWAIVLISTFMIDHFDLFGLRQVYLYWKGQAYEPIPFQTPGLYKYVRHPLMLGFILAFWAIPTMTAGHLLFAGATTGYIFVGIYFEEQALTERFGETYEAYRRETPMLIPGLKSRS